jgi:hypothetical protein
VQALVFKYIPSVTLAIALAIAIALALKTSNSI